MLRVPGTIEGKGDDVIVLIDSTPDTAIIKGNAEGRFFAVYSYSNVREMLAMTTDPYEGTVLVPSDAIVIEVKALEIGRLK